MCMVKNIRNMYKIKLHKDCVRPVEGNHIGERFTHALFLNIFHLRIVLFFLYPNLWKGIKENDSCKLIMSCLSPKKNRSLLFIPKGRERLKLNTNFVVYELH